MKLICIPAFNEEKNIEKIIKDCKKFVDDVIVCDDGSTDNTAALSKKQGAIVLQHKKNVPCLQNFQRFYFSCNSLIEEASLT